MMNELYTECRTLPAINETFPQFSARPSALDSLPLFPPPPPPVPAPPQPLLAPSLQQQQQTQRLHPVAPHPGNRLLSPLDLSLRAGVNIVPITPPSTPSPPRKRPRFMMDEPYLWRPHIMGGAPHHLHRAMQETTQPAGMEQRHSSPPPLVAYARREDMAGYAMAEEEEDYAGSCASTLMVDNRLAAGGCLEQMAVNNNAMNEIPRSQRSEYLRQQDLRAAAAEPGQQQMPCGVATIYVDDETIVLTEDEDEDEEEERQQQQQEEEDNDEDEEEQDMEADEEDEENETLVSSQELSQDMATNEKTQQQQQQQQQQRHPYLHKANSLEPGQEVAKSEDLSAETEEDEEEEEEYVDILSNDDDDVNPLSSKAITMLRLQSHSDLEEELDRAGDVLTRNKLVYEDEELHNRAVDGLAKLFDRNFAENSGNERAHKEKTYIDLTNCPKRTEQPYMQAEHNRQDKQDIITAAGHATAASRPPYRSHKTERKRAKLRKHMSLDEETISPVSGTIIRKLRDDEELVVRKGDIDPAFNVVEVTEEAKAILASIDNKIGAYLCQLCRTLYDDAFKLAQHRCPRIVHIEYKCSECEKVFNCPANLASHRRWHKPKSELLANSQAKKRPHPDRLAPSNAHMADKSLNDDGIDGIYPCNQCGKTFRRHAYLKKHQASHQMLENLKSLDIFKHSSASANALHPAAGHHHHLSATGLPLPHRLQGNPLYPPMVQPRPYAPATARFGSFPFGAPFDHRRFYTLGEFYLSQQLERSSAFQYVQQANHLRNLGNVAAGQFAPRPIVPSPLGPLPVK